MITMAKYKFTKTIKPNEGVCIDANGTVSKLPTPSVPMLKSSVADARVEKSHITISTASSKWDRPHKNHKWVRPKRFVSPNPDLISTEPKPRKEPAVVVPLTSKDNPYHGERALHDVPPARPCGIFGVSCPKPINQTAAMSFQNR
jgi:hypothetical protein